MVSHPSRRRSLRTLLVCCVLPLAVSAVGATPPTDEPPLNFPFPTLGGKQVWADEFFHAGWRIQKNVLTGHYRLLDERDIRRAWGSYEHCRTAFAAIRQIARPVYRHRHLVILVHGLGRSTGMFDDLAESLRADGLETAAISYASTREGIDTHAGHLARLVENLEGIDEVSFVTHSMGALVVRALLARPDLKESDIRFRRLVMIAPPNRGSAIARVLKDWAVYRWLTSEAGQDLTPTGARRIPVPTIEFAIIAGGRGNATGFNPFLDGDNDGTVTVEETRLDGARDFLIVPRPHGLVDNHPAAVRAVRSFLRDGSFSQTQP